MSDLKPCPFCGGEANVIDHHNDDGSVSVGCNNDTCLGFSGLGWLYKTEAGAIAAWNSRAERTCKMEYSGGVHEFLSLDTWTCSECGCEMYDVAEPRYCPNCGCKVVGE